MRRERRLEFAFAGAAALLSLLAASLVLRLWHADLGVPFVYAGDANFHHAIVKGTLEHGWYLENGNLAAPSGQELYDFPVDSGASGPVALVHILGLGTSNAAVVVNLFFLVSFPLVATVAFLVLRRLAVTRPVALACAVLYALAPYHFLRGEGHLYLSAYYAVPVGAFLVLAVLGGEPLFGPGWRRRIVTLALCLVAATGGTYYAVFTVALLAAASLVSLALRRRARVVGSGLAAAAVVAVLAAAQFTPTLVHDLVHGRLDVGRRSPSESEIFGLRIAELVLPLPTHRLEFLAREARAYYSTRPLPLEQGPTLGAIATIGFVSLLGVALASCAGARGRRGDGRARHAAAATVLALLVAVAGGASTLVAYLVTAQFRVWSRMSIFIAFFAILAVALALDRLRGRLGLGRRAAAIFAGILAAALVLGVLDQTSNAFVPGYREIRTSYRSDRDFVNAIERKLPQRAMLYQLPHLPFPEAQSAPPAPFADYDPLRGYLHSRGLRWSYGAIKDGPDDWSGVLAPLPLRSILPGLAAAGFAGVYVDRFGYSDRGAGVETTLRHELRLSPLVSRDGRLSFFDLTPYGERLRRTLQSAALATLRAATLEPPRIVWGDDVWQPEQSGRRRWRWTRFPSVTLTLVNPARRAQAVIFSATVAAPSTGTRLVVRYPEGRSQELELGSRGTAVRRRLLLPRGTSTLQLSSDTRPFPPPPPDPRPAVYLQILDAQVWPAAFGP